MIPYTAYKLVHFLGIFALVTMLATVATHALMGGTRADAPHRRALGISFGAAMFLVLLGGFGMLSRLGIAHTGLPTWVLLKLAIWTTLGVLIALPYRGRGYARAILIALPLLGVLAGATALYKPF